MNKSNVGANTDTVHILMDVFIMALSLAITTLFHGNSLDVKQYETLLILVVMYAIIFILSNKQEHVYNVTLFYYLDRIYKKITKSFLLGALCTSTILYFFASRELEAYIYLMFLILSYVLSCFYVFFSRKFVGKVINHQNVPRTAFVGSVDSFNKFFYFLEKTSIYVERVGYISMNSDEDSDEYIGNIEDLENLIREYNLDQIYILQKRETDLDYIQRYIDLCIEMGVTCRVIVDFYKRRRANSYVSSVGTYPVITYHTISLNTGASMIKRFVDIVGALAGIILTSPIMLVAAIAIKIDSPGPVLFKQVRVGQNGRHFKIYKFRSMYIDAEERKAELMEQNEMDGLMFKMKNDPRITKVGKFIRKCSIDELPQFFNVLGGSMSLVGTRPPTVDEVAQYERGQWRRISIKPGITGMWQVNGRSNVQNFDDVVAMDVEYIDNWSLFLDIKIIFKTVAVLLGHDGAY